jgi:hypothetical protein
LPFLAQDDRACTVVRNSASPELTASANDAFEQMFRRAERRTLLKVREILAIAPA